MTDLGLLWHSLGIEYLFHSNGITVTQHGYAVQMFIEFGFLHCNAVAVPMFPRLKLK
jgi:hypothetical protein